MEQRATQVLFTDRHIESLRESYGTLVRIDPCSKSYEDLVALLDKLPPEHLKQLASSDIKFVSKLAKNRVNKWA